MLCQAVFSIPANIHLGKERGKLGEGRSPAQVECSCWVMDGDHQGMDWVVMKSDGAEAALHRDVSVSMRINVSEMACKLRSLFYPLQKKKKNPSIRGICLYVGLCRICAERTLGASLWAASSWGHGEDLVDCFLIVLILYIKYLIYI